MNGVHDMGGMHGMGPINEDKSEPVFHAIWESRAYGVTRAMGGWRLWNLDATRFQRELIAPVDYFRMSYYERWIAARGVDAQEQLGHANGDRKRPTG